MIVLQIWEFNAIDPGGRMLWETTVADIPGADWQFTLPPDLFMPLQSYALRMLER